MSMSILRNQYAHRICTAGQCRNADRRTIDELGMDGFTLMETAGIQAARALSKLVEDASSGLYICGKGNNAGDALVTARYLTLHNRHSCTILLLFGRDELSEDTSRNLALLTSLEQQGVDITFSDDADIIRETGWDYLVDGMLGTGGVSEIRAPLDRAIQLINEQPAPVFAMDIPTGIHPDSGVVMGSAVKATRTFSFGALKTGYYFQDGPEYCGTVEQILLTFPDSFRESTATLLDPLLADTLPPVTRTGEHKYSDGVLYLIAGSEGLTGAAIMAAKSAWNTGIGALFLLAPRGLLPIYEQSLPQVIKCPVGGKEDIQFTDQHIDQATDIMNRHPGTLLIGPGLGREKRSLLFAQKILEAFPGNSVIDADALAVTADTKQPSGSSWILTPHPGELKYLGHSYQNDYSRFEWATSYTDPRNISIVSKGSPAIARIADGHCLITGYDTRIFSRAGFGDVLSGKIAGFFALTGNPEASIIHGLLDGYRKTEQFRKLQPGTPVEPAHIL